MKKIDKIDKDYSTKMAINLFFKQLYRVSEKMPRLLWQNGNFPNVSETIIFKKRNYLVDKTDVFGYYS